MNIGSVKVQVESQVTFESSKVQCDFTHTASTINYAKKYIKGIGKTGSIKEYFI